MYMLSSTVSSSSNNPSTITTTSFSSSSSSISTTSKITQSTTHSASSTQTGPAIKPTIGAYTYYGCQTEATGIRALSNATLATDSMTLEICENFCQGYKYWGAEYGRECYCGNAWNTGSMAAPESDCSFPCANNTLEYCGAGNRLSSYMLTS